MPIGNIQNRESGLSVRGKINSTIDAVNEAPDNFDPAGSAAAAQAFARQRANHTGTQGIETVSGLVDALDERVVSGTVGDESVTTSAGTQTVEEALDRRQIVFNSIADMVAAEGLQVGARVRTLGYYASGDGGGNDYEIVAAGAGTDDGGSFIDLSGSDFQAKGLFGSIVSVLQFGAIGNGQFDNRDSIKNCIDYSLNVYFPEGVYKVSDPFIGLRDNLTIQGDGKKKTIISKIQNVENNGPIFSAPEISGVFQPVIGLTLSDIGFEGNGGADEKVNAAAALVRIYKAIGMGVFRCDFYKSRNYGLGLQGRATSNVAEDRQGPSIDCVFVDCDFYDNGKTEYLTGIGETNHDGLDIKSSINTKLIRCRAWGNGKDGFDVRGSNSIFENCESYNNGGIGFSNTAFQTPTDLGLICGGTLKNCLAYDNQVRNYSSGSSDSEVDFVYDHVTKFINCVSKGQSNFDVEGTKLGASHTHSVEITGCEFIQDGKTSAIRVNTSNPIDLLSVNNSNFYRYSSAISARDIPSGGSTKIIGCTFKGGQSGVALSRNVNVVIEVSSSTWINSPSGTKLSTTENADYSLATNLIFRNCSGTLVNLAGSNSISQNIISF